VLALDAVCYERAYWQWGSFALHMKCMEKSGCGSFQGGMHRNGVPIVKVFKNAKTALDCRILHIQSPKFFNG